MGDFMTFGEYIRQAREGMLLSQEDVSTNIEKKYGVRLSASYLSMIESGVRTNITVNLLNALLDYFDLPLVAANSLFSKSLTEQPQGLLVKEAGDQYDVKARKVLLLPESARQCMAEFEEYLINKYVKKT